jgi:hypothetical protein
MNRTYSILSTNGELQTSPYIKQLQQKYDLVLSANSPKVVNFLFQLPIYRTEAHEVFAMYDEDVLTIGDIYVDCFSNQTLISTTITPKEIGVMKITFVIPDRLALAGVHDDESTYGY